MARQLRLEYDGALYHVTARGNGRVEIYLKDTERRCIRELLGDEVEQPHWRCYAFCLMGNHSHLLLETQEGNLSRGMRRLNKRGRVLQYNISSPFHLNRGEICCWTVRPGAKGRRNLLRFCTHPFTSSSLAARHEADGWLGWTT
jgi:REP element-mobilizing transposase RayT